MRATKIETKFIGVKVPVALNTQLEALARVEGNNVSSIVRRLLLAAVARESHQASAHGDAAA